MEKNLLKWHWESMMGVKSHSGRRNCRIRQMLRLTLPDMKVNINRYISRDRRTWAALSRLNVYENPVSDGLCRRCKQKFVALFREI